MVGISGAGASRMAARPSIRRRVRFVPSTIKLLGRSKPGVGGARIPILLDAISCRNQVRGTIVSGVASPSFLVLPDV